VNKQPLISILVCNYNYGRYIEECLNSAYQQDYPNIEIVVVDDGSTDNSIDVINGFIKSKQKNNIKIELRQKKKNQGICYARNDAIALAKGEYFVFLDSDDIIAEDYVSRLYSTAIKKNADVVYCDMESFGSTTSVSNFPSYDQSELLIHNYVHISSLVRALAIGTHSFDVALNRKSLEDYDFWVGLSLKDLNFVKADGVVLHYRVQEESRNSNTASYLDRMSEALDAWIYIISKYQKEYPTKIKEGIVFDKLKYQVKDISTELNRINSIVHEDLLPELAKREKHINYLDEQLQEQLQKLNSTEYKIGIQLMAPLRKVKSIFKKI